MKRTAQCHCGSLRVTCERDPALVLACHCELCQRRTGSVIHVAAWFEAESVHFEGESNAYTRTSGDQGFPFTFHFCPVCGTSVWWVFENQPARVGVAVGCFADPTFPAPAFSVYNKHRHPWVSTPDGDPCFADSVDPETIRSFATG